MMTSSAHWTANSFVRNLRQRDLYAFNCLRELIEQGCSTDKLVPLLSLLGQPEAHIFADWSKNFGGKNSVDLRNFAGKIKAMAKSIRQFNSTQAGWAAFVASGEDSPLLNIPCLLQQYAERLRALASLGGPKKAFARNEHRRNVVRNVKQATGSYHDKEVAAIIAAVENNSEYSRGAHIRWRNANLK
jgi:hypothetical protein